MLIFTQERGRTVLENIRLPSPPTDYGIAIALGIACSIGYVILSYIGAVLFGLNFTGGDYGMLLAYSVAMVAIPVALWFRYGLLAPLALMGLIIAFWQVLVPLLGNEGDGTPVFALALAMAPLYLIAYVLLAGIEFGIRFWLQ